MFLRRALMVGAAFDLGCALLILIPLREATALLGIPVGEPTMHFRFAGLLLALLPVYYVMGAATPALAAPVSAGAILVRCGGTVFLVSHLAAGEAAPAYWLFAGAEVLFALLHAAALRQAGIPIWDALRGRSAMDPTRSDRLS